MTTKKTLTKDRHLQLIGLYSLGNSLRDKLDAVQDSIGELLGIPDDGGHYYGLASDQVFEESSPTDKAAIVLKRLGITVK